MLQPKLVAPVGPAEAARRLGVSVKALKIYERHRLVRPKRTAEGWRLYSAEDIDRLSRAMAFKAMGFGLAQIASLLDAEPADLAAALAAQEQHLLDRRKELDNAFAALRDARRSSGAPTLRLVA